VRALTINLFAHNGDWPARRKVLRAGLRELRPDVLTLQEAIVGDGYDQAVELLGPDYAVVHQRQGLIGDGRHHGASVASRWPITAVHEIDLHLTPRTGDYSCGAVIPGLDRGRRIDYLLVRCGDHGPPLRVTDCQLALHEPVGGVHPSDHYGVVADLAEGGPGQVRRGGTVVR
jgi:exonuclease III